ncbi:MAG TPA: phosphoribosylaminoimidazolesuccinocarboxamide synthase, partial [Pyrinomonadaceae bacterium]|nr:phosphoribosylaminoimidazolesuccinocarboxamide synthase [Pyrinomonadaceae bacterium]
MIAVAPVVETTFSDLTLLKRGKVRDVYQVDENSLLIVATDRVSAFDCVIPTPIERKGEVLTSLSQFWFAKLGNIVPHHLLTTNIEEMPATVRNHASELRGRSMLVRKTDVFPVECVVRGYITGS